MPPITVLQDGAPLDLPNRHPALPQLYLVLDHPLRAGVLHRNTYVYLCDSSKEGAKRQRELDKKLRVHSGTREEVNNWKGMMWITHSQ